MNLVWKAEEVLCAVRGQSLHAQDWIAHGVSIDSRTTRPGDVFVAIRGDALDGHDFVYKAIEAGAVAAIVDRQPAQVPQATPLIHVDDTFAALQDMGRVGRARAKGKIIAVTGSVGKTSSKEQLRLMLGAINDTYATEGSLNNHWGVPLSLARLPAESKYGVFEIGMNHAGELGPLSREVQPHVALITNIEPVHLEFFPSLEAIADAKAEIFLGMDPNGIAVLNRDNPHYARLLAAARTQGLKKTLSFGRDPKSDARLLSCRADDKGTDVEAKFFGEDLSFRVGVPGAHFAFNALGTLLACTAVGADLKTCAEALASFRQPEGRGTTLSVCLAEDRNFTIIDESFNASPVATRAAIDVLGLTPVPPSGRRIAVLGDMRELGATSAELHVNLVDSLVKNRINLVHCCGEMMAHLFDALPDSLRGVWKPDSAALAPAVAENVRAGDVFLVKGSKSMKMPYVIKALMALDVTATLKKKAG